MRISRQAALAAFTVLMAAASAAEESVLVLDPAASKVSFTLEATGHDVEGILAVQSGRIAFDPETGAAAGEITVDLKSARTGNGSRDRTMHEKVLEDAAYPLAVFRAEHLRGALAPAGPSQVTLDGTLTFHGADHKVSLPAKVEVKDGRLTAETSFPVPFVEWGLQDPSLAFLRVAKVVSVKVVARGALEGGSLAGAGRP